MSFLAILTLGLVCPYIHRVYDGVLVGSIAVQIGLGPYILWQFNTLSLIAVFINVPVIMLSGVLVPAGMLGMLLPAGTGLFDCGLDCLCRMMLRMNELAHIDHLTYMTVASPPVWVIAAFYISLLVFASEEGRLLIMRRQKQMAIGLATLVLLVSMIFGHAADDGFRHMDMVFVDVGQGDCMHLRSGSRNYLIDGGGSTDYSVGEKTLRPYLLKNGVSRIEGAFVTHLHTDHYQGICDLAKAGMIRHLYVYEANRVQLPRICEETGLAESAVVFLRQGQTVNLPGGNRIDVLWPSQKTDKEYQVMIADEENENASSLILRVTIDGTSMLATGDLDEDGEQELLRQYGSTASSDSSASVSLQTDILKIGHHGSKTSSSEEFLDAVRPAFAVIQVGKNNIYGHPTPEVLRRLKERRIPVYRNDLQGAVGFEFQSGRVKQVRTILHIIDENKTEQIR